jgi:RNA polymerase sigma-70 factor (ECF subfamily)
MRRKNSDKMNPLRQPTSKDAVAKSESALEEAVDDLVTLNLPFNREVESAPQDESPLLRWNEQTEGGDERLKEVGAGALLGRATDKELVCLCQGGEQRAFEMLIERYQDNIYNFMLGNVGDEEAARDLAQEVFIRAFQNLPGFRMESLFKTWLFRIARNLYVDNYRRRKRRLEINGQPSGGSERRKLEEDWFEGVRDESKADTLQGLIGEEVRIQVRSALQKLPEKTRNALILYDLEGFSCEEVARMTGCPVGTVKSRLFNGRLKLRELLRPYIERGANSDRGA